MEASKESVRQISPIYILGAPDNTRKTFLILLILTTIRLHNEIILILASPGNAATLLEGGLTAYLAINCY